MNIDDTNGPKMPNVDVDWQSGGWQPIETAPKDGSIFIGAWGRGAVDTCRWFDLESLDCGGYFHNADEKSRCCSDVLTHPDGDPTHWMPLPNPPHPPNGNPAAP